MGLKKEKRKTKQKLNHYMDTLLSLDHEIDRLKKKQLEETATMEVLTAVRPLLTDKIWILKAKLAKIKKEHKK
jgi:hypothetical protein